MEGMVVGQERRGIGAGDFAKGLVEGICGNGGIQTAESLLEATGKEDLLKGLTLGGGLTGGDVGAEDRGVVEVCEPGEGGGFDKRFREGQGASPMCLLLPLDFYL